MWDVYNKIYHFLRAINLNAFAPATTNRQAHRQLQQLTSILQEMNSQLLGGIRIEVRIAATTLEDAIGHRNPRPTTHDSKSPKVGNTQRRPNVYKCLPGQGKYTHANGNTDLHTKPLHQSRSKKRKRPRWRSQALSRPKPQWIQDWSHKPNCMVATKHKCHSRWRWCQWKRSPAASAMHLHQNLHRHTSYQTEPSSGYANRAKI